MGEEACRQCPGLIDATDVEYRPCDCGWRVCVWCWWRLQMDTMPPDEVRCQGCQKKLDVRRLLAKVDSRHNVLPPFDAAALPRPPASDKKGAAAKVSQSFLVVNRRTLHLRGLPKAAASDELLRGAEHCAKYGTIVGKVLVRAMDRQKAPPSKQSSTGTPAAAQVAYEALVTYTTRGAAEAAIASLNHVSYMGRVLRASHSTHRLCPSLIRKEKCAAAPCASLHAVPDDAAVVNKLQSVAFLKKTLSAPRAAPPPAPAAVPAAAGRQQAPPPFPQPAAQQDAPTTPPQPSKPSSAGVSYASLVAAKSKHAAAAAATAAPQNPPKKQQTAPPPAQPPLQQTPPPQPQQQQQQAPDEPAAAKPASAAAAAEEPQAAAKPGRAGGGAGASYLPVHSVWGGAQKAKRHGEKVEDPAGEEDDDDVVTKSVMDSIGGLLSGLADEGDSEEAGADERKQAGVHADPYKKLKDAHDLLNDHSVQVFRESEEAHRNAITQQRKAAYRAILAQWIELMRSLPAAVASPAPTPARQAPVPPQTASIPTSKANDTVVPAPASMQTDAQFAPKTNKSNATVWSSSRAKLKAGRDEKPREHKDEEDQEAQPAGTIGSALLSSPWFSGNFEANSKAESADPFHSSLSLLPPFDFGPLPTSPQYSQKAGTPTLPAVGDGAKPLNASTSLRSPASPFSDLKHSRLDKWTSSHQQETEKKSMVEGLAKAAKHRGSSTGLNPMARGWEPAGGLKKPEATPAQQPPTASPSNLANASQQHPQALDPSLLALYSQMAGQMTGQMGNQMASQLANQMPGQMQGQMQGQMAGQMPNQAAGQMSGLPMAQTMPFPMPPMDPMSLALAMNQMHLGQLGTAGTMPSALGFPMMPQMQQMQQMQQMALMQGLQPTMMPMAMPFLPQATGLSGLMPTLPGVDPRQGNAQT